MSEKEKSGEKLLDRITMFNDAVYAIVLTILALELKLPTNEGHVETAADMWHAIKEMSPILLAYSLSITLVGSNWLSSVNIQRMLKTADNNVMIYMVIYLTLISMAPFTCNLIGEYPSNPVSYVAFGTVTFLLAINGLAFMFYCRRKKLYHADVDMKELGKMYKIVWYVPPFIVLLSASAFYSTTLSFVLFLTYNLIPFFSSKSLRVNHKD